MNIFEAKNILKKCGYNLIKEVFDDNGNEYYDDENVYTVSLEYQSIIDKNDKTGKTGAIWALSGYIIDEYLMRDESRGDALMNELVNALGEGFDVMDITADKEARDNSIYTIKLTADVDGEPTEDQLQDMQTVFCDAFGANTEVVPVQLDDIYL